MAEPKSQTWDWTLQSGQFQRQLSCWINDSSTIKMWLSEEDEELCLWGLSACGQQEDMIIEWLHLSIQCETGDVEQGKEAAEQSREDVTESGDVWKGREPGCCKIFGPHWVVLIACTICYMSASLDVQLLPFAWVAQLQWNDAESFCIHAILLPKQQSDHSYPTQAGSQMFLYHFPGFVSNWAGRLNRFNLSQEIISIWNYCYLEL